VRAGAGAGADAGVGTGASVGGSVIIWAAWFRIYHTSVDTFPLVCCIAWIAPPNYIVAPFH
jgi:hypothetical protein